MVVTLKGLTMTIPKKAVKANKDVSSQCGGHEISLIFHILR